MKLFNLIIEIRRERGEHELMLVPFQISDELISPEEALRGVVQDFIGSGTKESRKALEYAGGKFNWGDALSSVPDEYFVNRGLTPMNDTESIAVVVDHDEVLDHRERR